MANKVKYELIGVKVLEKLPKIVGAGKRAGTKNWELLVEVENKPEIKKVQIFRSDLGLVGSVGQEQMWKDIEESNYADKRYLFWCHLDNKSYSLVGWKELSPIK